MLWRVKASQIGTARLLAKALTNEESDALEITFPVEPVGVQRRRSAGCWDLSENASAAVERRLVSILVTTMRLRIDCMSR